MGGKYILYSNNSICGRNSTSNVYDMNSFFIFVVVFFTPCLQLLPFFLQDNRPTSWCMRWCLQICFFIFADFFASFKSFSKFSPLQFNLSLKNPGDTFFPCSLHISQDCKKFLKITSIYYFNFIEYFPNEKF